MSIATAMALRGASIKTKSTFAPAANSTPWPTRALCEAPEGIEVTILGEHDEYFKIKPPPGAFLYVNSKYVDHDTQAKPQPLGRSSMSQSFA